MFEHSETIGKVLAKIGKVSKSAGVVGRTSDNPFFKSKYIPLEHCQQRLEPLLDEHGLSVSQPLSGYGIMTIISDEESGEWVAYEAHPLDSELDVQKQMGWVTYAKRYALVGAFNLQAGDKDDDGNFAASVEEVDTELLKQYSEFIEWGEDLEFAALNQYAPGIKAVADEYIKPFAAKRKKTEQTEVIRRMIENGHAEADDWAQTLINFAADGNVDGIREIRDDLSKFAVQLVWTRLPATVKADITEMMG